MRTPRLSLMPFAVLALAVLLLCAAAARAADKKKDAPAEPTISTLAESDGPLEAIKDPAGLKELMPLSRRSGAYQFKAGKKPEREIEYRLEPDEDDAWVFTLDEDHVTYYKPGKGGGVVIPRETDIDSHVEITYSPALQMLPANWVDSTVIDGTCTMVVKNTKTGLVREKGTCIYRVELLGRQKIHTAAGDFDACLVRETRHIRLNLAKSDVTSLTWYVPGQGEIAEHNEQSTKALGFIGGKKVQETRLSR